MSKTERVYAGSDSEMLTVLDTLMDHAIDCEEYLVSKRPSWANPFFSGVKARVKHGFEDLLGISGTDALTASTAEVHSLQGEAYELLADIKVQIEVDFRKSPARCAQILSQLGYTSLFKEAQKKSQQSLVELLFKFKLALTPELKEELVTNGIDGAALDQVVGYAMRFSTANTAQEGKKVTRKEVTESTIAELNDIYEEVIGICKIATSFYRNDTVKKEYFSYSKALNNLRANARNPKETPSAPTA